MYRELCATDLFGVFGFGAFRPRIGVFWWTIPPSNPVPSTYWGVFVDGTAFQPCSIHVGAVFVDGKDDETMFVLTSDSSSECPAP